MQNDWSIQSRADTCAATGRKFQEGEHFFTLLYRDRHGFHREDLSEAAWKERRAGSGAGAGTDPGAGEGSGAGARAGAETEAGEKKKSKPQGQPQPQPPFSFWRSKFEPPPPPPPETLGKETAEELLRRYMQETDTRHGSARYILALMLERKRLLKQIDTERTADGGRTLIYEHTKTGEIFVIPDPHLRLDQIEQVQSEVAALLG